MSQIHAKTENLTLVAVPEKGDKMRVTSSSLEDPLVILPFRVPWQETITPNWRGGGLLFAPAAPDPMKIFRE